MAFLCGVLHDIGKPIALGIIADWCRIKGHAQPPVADFRYQLDEIHAEVGRQIIGLWKLPEVIIDAVGFHHYPLKKGVLHQMAGVTAVADLCCTHAGIGRPRRTIEVMSEKTFFDLNLNPNDAEKLLHEAETIAEEVSCP